MNPDETPQLTLRLANAIHLPTPMWTAPPASPYDRHQHILPHRESQPSLPIIRSPFIIHESQAQPLSGSSAERVRFLRQELTGSQWDMAHTRRMQGAPRKRIVGFSRPVDWRSSGRWLCRYSKKGKGWDLGTDLVPRQRACDQQWFCPAMLSGRIAGSRSADKRHPSTTWRWLSISPYEGTFRKQGLAVTPRGWVDGGIAEGGAACWTFAYVPSSSLYSHMRIWSWQEASNPALMSQRSAAPSHS